MRGLAKKFLRKNGCIVCVALTVACSHKPPEAPPVLSMPPPAPAVTPAAGSAVRPSEAAKEKNLFDSGYKALAKSDYKAAAQKFSELLSEFPASKWLPHAEYNLGLALEGEEKYPEASEEYKKVVDYYQGSPGRDSAEALYRMSVCFEALNDDPKVILALLELKNQKKFLAHETAEVELPARLAAAYARQGNAEQARSYFAYAETGLKRLRVLHPKGDTLLWLPKTLYSMGYVTPPKKDLSPADFKNYLASLNQNQIWLVRAAEMGENPWSRKAAENLVEIYFDAWDAIDKHAAPKESDTLQAMKTLQDDQRSMAADLDASISRLRLERLPPSPMEPEAPRLKTVFNGVDGIEKRLDLLLQRPYVQDQPTAESQKREGLKREGVIKEEENSSGDSSEQSQ